MSNVLYHDGNFDTAQTDGPVRWIAPFANDGDLYAYIYEQSFIQKIAKWKPETLSSAGTIAPYFLVEETNIEHIGGGIGRWSRIYAYPPRPRILWESYAWRVPGLSPDVSPIPIAISGTPTHAAGKTTITTVADHGLQADDGVIIRYNVKFNNETAEATHAVFRKVITITTRTSFTVDLITEEVTVWHSINEAGGRSPTTEVVASKIEAFYFHCVGIGGQLKTPEDIPILSVDTITNNLNEETDTYSPTTNPTLASYQAKITAKEWIVAEASIIRRWHGNIYERSTRFVRAE